MGIGECLQHCWGISISVPTFITLSLNMQDSVKMDWIFDGIGTEIIGIILSLIIGAIGGGVVGYKIGVKRTTKQKQSAGDDSEQKQELRISPHDAGTTPSKSKTSIKQSQKAGSNSVQTQIGEIKDDRR